MIPEVGYLHEHSEIEAATKRQGIHPINEDELIQIMNMAIVNQGPSAWDSRCDHLAGSHLLTRVEFIGPHEQQERAFEGDNYFFAEPRAALFTASFSRRTAGESETHSVAAHLPREIARALRDHQNTASILDELWGAVSKKLSNHILLPESGPEADRPLGEFGLDSVLAADFRTFVFRTFEVDIPFVSC